MAIAEHEQVSVHHQVDQRMEGRHRTPTEFDSCLGCVTLQDVDLGRAIVARIDANDDLPGAYVEPTLIRTLTLPCQGDTGPLECHFHKLAHGMRLARRNHVIIRSVLLQYEPHCLYVFLGISPISLCIHIAKIYTILQTFDDTSHRHGHLARDKRLAPSW